MKAKQGTLIRVICPDSHGSEIDHDAKKAFLGDIERIQTKWGVDEFVHLGDLMECSGPLSEHQPSTLEEKTYYFEQDVDDCNTFLDDVQKRIPGADQYLIEGNHDAHVARYAARYLSSQFATRFMGAFSPEKLLRLKERGIRYFHRHEHHMGLRIPGAIKLGKCCFWHGGRIRSTEAVLRMFNYNVVHGHTHRPAEACLQNVRDGELRAWCPGTLAKLQPLYIHPNLSTAGHGYSVQFVNRGSGNFQHVNVAIIQGKSMAGALLCS